MSLLPVNPEELGAPRGYNNGLRGRGEWLFVAGQVGWGPNQRIVSSDFAEQFVRAVDNVLAVVHAAGGRPQDIARMTVYVTDKAAYVAARPAIGAAWRERFGRHYPAMALVVVQALLEDGALCEIEATAVLPERIA
ncbi:MAG: RidA family protein [Vicinamibacteria bacterium]|nr:RidA family protein [Vicinamibacteria bacterium]